MNRSQTYIILGDPIPLARARHTRGRVYDDQKHIKLVWGLELNKQQANLKQFQGPLQLDITFFLPIPKTSIKKSDSLRDSYHSFKPDASNLLKFVEDVATGIIYKDDCIISKILLDKKYDDGNGPRTQFTLTELR